MKHLIVPHIWDDFSMGGRHKWKKRESGPPVLVGLQKMFGSVSHHFSKKSEQSVEGIFDIADYIYS